MLKYDTIKKSAVFLTVDTENPIQRPSLYAEMFGEKSFFTPINLSVERVDIIKSYPSYYDFLKEIYEEKTISVDLDLSPLCLNVKAFGPIVEEYTMFTNFAIGIKRLSNEIAFRSKRGAGNVLYHNTFPGPMADLRKIKTYQDFNLPEHKGFLVYEGDQPYDVPFIWAQDGLDIDVIQNRKAKNYGFLINFEYPA